MQLARGQHNVRCNELIATFAFKHGRFGNSSAWLRINDRRVFYVYDSYHVAPEDWAKVLKDSTDEAISSSFFVALWLNQNGGDLVRRTDSGVCVVHNVIHVIVLL